MFYSFIYYIYKQIIKVMVKVLLQLWNAVKTNWKYILIGAIITAIYALVFGLMQMTFTSIVIFTNVSIILTIILGAFYGKLVSSDFKLTKIGWTAFIPIILDIFVLLKFIF